MVPSTTLKWEVYVGDVSEDDCTVGASPVVQVRHKCTTNFPTTVSLLLLSLLIFFHIISVRHKCAITFPTTVSLLLL